jgi:signal transduction histidine kinase
MIQEAIERRSEFRFPVVVPVKYFTADGSEMFSYTLNLSNHGAFISTDDNSLDSGIRFSLNLGLSFDQETSRVFRTEGRVVWNRARRFKSSRNGMGVRFIEALPEWLLLKALGSDLERLIKETEAKGLLEERVERLESELERSKRLATLGRYAQQIVLELSNPIVTLIGTLERVKTKIYEHRRMLEGHEEINQEEFKRIVIELDKSCNKIDKILRDYKIISQLGKILRDDRETLERTLKRKYKG